MTARNGHPAVVAESLIDAQLRALDMRVRQWREVHALRWSNKHVPPAAPIEQIISRAVDEIIDIQAHTEENA